jgi:hypothetical protein
MFERLNFREFEGLGMWHTREKDKFEEIDSVFDLRNVRRNV